MFINFLFFLIFIALSFLIRTYLIRFLGVFANMENGEKFSDTISRVGYTVKPPLAKYFLIISPVILIFGIITGYFIYLFNLSDYFYYFLFAYFFHTGYNFYVFLKARKFFILVKKDFLARNFVSEISNKNIKTEYSDYDFEYLKENYPSLVGEAKVYLLISIFYIISFSFTFLYLFNF